MCVSVLHKKHELRGSFEIISPCEIATVESMSTFNAIVVTVGVVVGIVAALAFTYYTALCFRNAFRAFVRLFCCMPEFGSDWDRPKDQSYSKRGSYNSRGSFFRSDSQRDSQRDPLYRSRRSEPAGPEPPRAAASTNKTNPRAATPKKAPKAPKPSSKPNLFKNSRTPARNSSRNARVTKPRRSGRRGVREGLEDEDAPDLSLLL